MREPGKLEIGQTVMDLINLETHYQKGWNIPKQTAKLIAELKEDLIWQYQFTKH